MPALAELHAWLAVATAVLAVALTVVALLLAVGVLRSRRWLDRLILALLVAVAAALLLGPVIAIGRGAGPADPLHFVYAMVALLAVPVARLVAYGRGSTRVGWWVVAGGLVTLGALLRLWATGG